MSPRSWPHGYQHFRVSFPHENVLQVTLDRQDKLNCIDQATSKEIAQVWEVLDQDDSLWVGIITGTGRAFCTGADLSEWDEMNKRGQVNSMAPPGLAGLPRRSGRKPIIAAVNGMCMGGGFEMIANCDVVVASASATFCLPEVKRGIVPVAGCLPRLALTLGLQRTMDLVLTGRVVSATTLHDWGLVSRLASAEEDVARVAQRVARDMCRNSPDALIVGRLGVRLAWEAGGVEDAVRSLAENEYPRLVAGANFKEGVAAFVQKRPPKWINPKL